MAIEKSIDSKAYNFFRPFPLLFIVGTILLGIAYSPIFIYELKRYISGASIESIWPLFCLSISLFVWAIPLFILKSNANAYRKNVWMNLAFCLLFPIAAGLSIKIGELLGAILMGVLFFFTFTKLGKGSNHERYYKLFLGLLFALYLFLRFAGFPQGMLDVALLLVYGLFLLRHAFTILFVTRNEYYQKTLSLFFSVPLFISVLYFCMCLILPQKYDEFILLPEDISSVQQKENQHEVKGSQQKEPVKKPAQTESANQKPEQHEQGFITFKATAPETVAMGQQFQLIYTLNTETTNELQQEEFSAFEVVSGPFRSTSHSVQFNNGKSTSETTTNFTYILRPMREATFYIPPASVKVKNATYTSNSVLVKVVRAEANQEQADKEQERLRELERESAIEAAFNRESQSESGQASNNLACYASFNLNGRTTPTGLPLPSYIQEEGRIMIRIVVDPQGNVVSAEIAEGTGIDNVSMRNNALEAARQSKFNNISGGANQTGTITYRYRAV